MEGTLEHLRKLAAEKGFDELENVWMGAAESPRDVGERLDAFLDIAEVILSQERETGRTGALLELLVASLSEATPPRVRLRYQGLLVRCFPANKEHRAAFAELFEGLHPLASAERAFYEASGYPSGANPAAALARLERLLRFREGAYVFHRSGWGIGRVTAVDPFLKQVKVDLEHKRDHRIAIEAVDSILEPLAPDSFLVLSHLGGQGLRRLRDEDPVRLVAMACETFGNPLALKDLKARLVPVAVDAGGWNKWWNRTKGLLREVGHFRVGDRAPYLVEKLDRAVSYEEELLRDFHRSDWPHQRQIARQVCRRGAGELDAVWAQIRERLEALCKGKTPSAALEAALILERGDGGVGREHLMRILAGFTRQDLLSTIESVQSAEDQRRAVEALPEARPSDWLELTSALFLSRKGTARGPAVQLLERQVPGRTLELLREIAKSPKSAPEAFCAALGEYLEASRRGTALPWAGLEIFREKSDRDLLVLTLDLLDHLQHTAQRRGRASVKEILGGIENILGLDRCRFFEDVLKAMSSPERHEVHARIVRHDSLDVHLKGTMLQIIMQIEPSLERSSETAPWEESAIYVTKEGLERKRAEFREIMEVKLPKVGEDIGRAAAFGDLSENAEYTAALEERDHLTKRATKIKEELDRVKLITPDMVRDGVAGLGSRVRLLNLRSGEEIAYSVLGPWDGGPEDGILNYLSPLGRLFHGKRPGEEVEAQFPGGAESFRLLEVRSHFEPPR